MLSMRSFTIILFEILCLQAISNLFTVWPLVTLNDLWPAPKIMIIYSIWAIHILSMRSLTVILLEICVYKVFIFWPLVTPNDLWIQQKTIGTIYSVCPIYTLSMKSLIVTLIEISCLQTKCYIHTCTHTHTQTQPYIQTHTTSPRHRFLMPPARNN